MSSLSDRREPVLDGIRGVAILLVVFHHVVIFSGMTRDATVDRVVRMFGNASWLGVDLFFVLSGFLITGILYDTRESPSYFRSFYGRRVLRIFPLYYGFLALTLVAGPLWLSAETAAQLTDSQGWYWTYLSNVQVALYGWQQPLHIGHFWSLAVEEQFYLIWPFVVAALDRSRLMRVAGSCFVIALALRASAPFDLSPLGAYVLMPTRMDSLAAGALLALAVRGPLGIRALGAVPVRLLAFGTAACAVVFLWRRGFNELDPVINSAGFSLFAATFACLVAAALVADERALLRRVLCRPTLLWLGQYSYGLYVFHQPIIMIVRESGWQADMLPRVWGSQLPGLAAFAAVVVALSIACALASWHIWEVPFLRLKRYFPYRPADRPAGSPAAAQVVTTP
jgi:peptidoglycan/LPS O-acetylase OafA/YrhL